VPAQSGWQRSSQQHGIIQEGHNRQGALSDSPGAQGRLHCSTPFIHLSPLSFLSSSYEADADMVMSVIALKPLLRSSNTGMLVEVSKGSTGSLLRGMAEVRVAVIHALTPLSALKPLLRGSNTGVVAEVSKGSTGSLLRGMADVRVSAVENLSSNGQHCSTPFIHLLSLPFPSSSYEADADVVMSVIALKPLLRGSNTGVVAEVSKGSTGSLLRGMAEVRVSAVENLSAKLFVQCSRQPGLVDVYCKLLDHTGGCGWKYHTGGDIQEWGRGVKGSAVENLSAKLFVQCSRQPGMVDVFCKPLDHTGELEGKGHLSTALENLFSKLFVQCSQQPGLIDGYCKLLDHTEGMAEVRGTAVENLSAKLFVQCSRQPGLVDVYCKLLDHTDEVINVRSFPSLAGLPYGLVRRGFPEAVCCGIVRDGKVQFHPKDSEPVQRTDKLMLIALKHTHRHPPPALMMQAAQIRQKQEISRGGREGRGGGSSEGMVRVHRDSALKTRDAGQFKPNEPAARAERMVMLGWRTGVPDMIREFDDYVGPGSELVILAEESLEERERQLARMLRTPLRNLTVVHKVGNPMSRTDLTDAILDPGSVFHPFVSAGGDMFFDNVPFSIIVVSDRSWHHGERTKPDKQSLYSLLLAESVCRANKIKVQSLNAELEDNRLGREVVGSHPSLTYIGTSDLMGLVTSQGVHLQG
ncbi:unnamed protein product, partial [Closterium sp. NIES-64]